MTTTTNNNNKQAKNVVSKETASVVNNLPVVRGMIKTTINNITFPANSAILAVERINATNNSITTNYIAVAIKNDKPLTAIKNLLIVSLADYKCKQEFDQKYSTIKDNGKVIQITNSEGVKVNLQSGLIEPLEMNKYLNTKEILISDGDGKIRPTRIVSEVPYKDTALKIRQSHGILVLSGRELGSGIHNQACAILDQTRRLTRRSELCNEMANIAE